VKSDERLTSDNPDSSSERAGAFVSVKRHVEESFVPLDTLVEITDRQSHVCNGWQIRHGSPREGYESLSRLILARECPRTMTLL
jgi:hypothetical protein